MRKRVQDRSAVHFAPYFDFEEAACQVPTDSKPDPALALRAASKRWIEAGNVLQPGAFGVETVERVRDTYAGTLTGTYRMVGEISDPLGIILDGKESRCMPVLDAARELETDEFWIVGFIHGFDRANATIIGKNLDKLMKSQNYLDGKRAGMKLRSEFIKDEEKRAA
jgi:hypothetical protein